MVSGTTKGLCFQGGGQAGSLSVLLAPCYDAAWLRRENKEENRKWEVSSSADQGCAMGMCLPKLTDLISTLNKPSKLVDTVWRRVFPIAQRPDLRLSAYAWKRLVREAPESHVPV